MEAAMPPSGWWIEDSEVDDLILGRGYEGLWDSECSDEQLNAAFDVVLAFRRSPISNASGLPDRPEKSRFWEIINRVWRATYFP
jgi:hypothetical protein